MPSNPSRERQRPAGVPLLGLSSDMTHYFGIHHTHANTFDKVDADDLSGNVAAMAIVAYMLADMPGRLGDGAGPGEPTTQPASDEAR